MARTKVSEWSSTPGNNTDIDGINVAENCPPSGINDAIRELMSQVKDWQAGTTGDSFNGPVGTTTAAAGAFTTLTTSGAVTHNGGTANGVAYLNGSKVLTTGSALTFDGSTLGAPALAVNGNNISAVNSMGFRNRIINGAMVIDQRNAGASVTINSGSAYVYGVDRWAGFGTTSAGVFTMQQSTVAPAGFNSSVLLTVTTASTPSGSNLYLFRQAIEGFNLQDIGWGTANAQPVTISFWARSSVTGTFGGSVFSNADANSYNFTYTISSANTWTYISAVIPARTTGSWSTNTNNYLNVVPIVVGAGTKTTANAWNTSGIQGSTGATDLIATNGATFYITGVQLEAGSVATPFERRDYGRELMMCQRYFYKMSAVAPIANCYYASPAYCMGNLDWPATMRAAPTVTIDSGHMFLVGDGTYSGVTGTVDRLYTLTFSGTGAAGYIGRGLVSASAEL